MKITIKDIAREANLSLSAVSQVLNNKPCRVSEEKKELIRSIAKKYNYSPNQIARSLVTKRTHTFGLIMPDIENIFFSSFAKRLEANCRRHGYALIITNTDDKYAEDQEMMDLLIARDVDGLFLIVSTESYQYVEMMADRLKRLNIPYVMVDRVYPEFNCNKVFFNHEMGAYLAVKHLIEQGHRKIGCIANKLSSVNRDYRLDGYMKAMREYGCEVHDHYIMEGNYRIHSGYHATQELLKTDITAFFVCNDMMTLGVFRKLHESGYAIPQDYSIVSYDNTIAPFLSDIKLTSIEQNVGELGDTAFQVLFDKLNNDQLAHQEICLLPKLIINASVKPILSNKR
ncbi:LacI family DNA-binding transcriptional regulator [Paenibacillus arenosi]|uniref:LacI family DNA-binding transcriptional regulator n=1 Tax=Paenibacillus arenosi TaxID=2774142 RepID=A0ABR9B1Y3_9BACL|nr:LacI family DNA-binding transcriptional regulator [Paenibacillus arenosi]MBD8500386.1 LacI family DNA-binding transcriptional regulator [Paenibacillus arenosi]